MTIFLLTLFVISIIFLIPTILLQTSGADNGVLSSNITAGAFGAKSNEILVKFTSWVATIFVACALALAIQYSKVNSANTSDEVIPEQAISVPAEDLEEGSTINLSESIPLSPSEVEALENLPIATE